MSGATLLATWFGAGLLRPAPGTWGSFAALPFGWALAWWGGWPALLAGAILVFAVGVWAADVHCRAVGRHDASEVVIDEVAGQWLTLLPAAIVAGTPSLAHLGAGFLLFRIFDVAKPWPCSLLDRKVKGGLGVMVDDVAAGIYGAAVLALLIWIGAMG